MFGLVDHVVRAERDLRDTPMNARSEPGFAVQVGLWRHKLLVIGLVALVLVGLILRSGGG